MNKCHFPTHSILLLQETFSPSLEVFSLTINSWMDNHNNNVNGSWNQFSSTTFNHFHQVSLWKRNVNTRNIHSNVSHLQVWTCMTEDCTERDRKFLPEMKLGGREKEKVGHTWSKMASFTLGWTTCFWRDGKQRTVSVFMMTRSTHKTSILSFPSIATYRFHTHFSVCRREILNSLPEWDCFCLYKLSSHHCLTGNKREKKKVSKGSEREKWRKDRKVGFKNRERKKVKESRWKWPPLTWLVWAEETK